MPTGKGLLAIRDADAPQALASPTRVTGTVDEETGVLSGVTLSTPPLNFETVALGFPVDVKATFVQVGQGSGLVAATPPRAAEGQAQKGTVALRVAVRVVLDMKIRDPNSGGIILEPHCETPADDAVILDLISDGSYTEAGGGRVVDTNFEVPEVQVNTADCIADVANGVNGLLAGPGHSLSLVIEGDLPVPPLKAETTTTLSVDPSGGSLRGTDVTLTATVAEVEANPADPTGAVVFREGTKVLGAAEVQPDGTAAITTDELRAGTRALTAAYQGDTEFAPSTSAAVTYSVAPTPILTGTVPGHLTRGAPPVEFDLTIDNTGSSRPIANARLDLTVLGLNSGDLELERQLPDTTWAPVPMPYSNTAGGVGAPGLKGTLGPDGGVVVPADAVVTTRLRVSVVAHAQVRPRALTAHLVTVDPDTSQDGPTVASGSWPVEIVNATRVATEPELIVYDQALRPGQQLYLDVYVHTLVDGVRSGAATTGMVEFLLDGKVLPFRLITGFGPLTGLETRAPIDDNGYVGVRADVPVDIATGPHVVTARYLGDSSYLPSFSVQEPLTIDDPLSAIYTCDFVTVTAVRAGAFVRASVRLPAHAERGAEVDLQNLEVEVILGGIDTPGFLNLVGTFGGFGTDAIEIDLGDAGTITGTSVAYEANWDSADQTLHLQGLEGSIVVDGEPGDVMALPIERIALSGTEVTVPSQFTFTCTPNDEAVVLDEIGVAGVALVAEPTTDPVRAGDAVVLTATAGPASPFGLVEFFSGSTSLGTASGASGTATITVDDLPAGSNSLTARYTGVAGSPFRSNVVALDVAPAVECAAFAQSGDGATVRLVYIELLGRCPDQAGFDYWTGRLAAGTSPAVFARSIARTPEAVGQVVDDAYRTMLGRAPDAAGRAFWVNRMRTGSGRYDQLLADLGASAEFWNLSGATRAGFVTRVYEQLLNRAPDEPGLDYWVARLTPGASRRTLILSLANLDEPLGRLVGLSYDEILGRTPSGTERTDGIAVLRRTGDRSGFYAQLIGQPEFSTRAQGFPNPED